MTLSYDLGLGVSIEMDVENNEIRLPQNQTTISFTDKIDLSEYTEAFNALSPDTYNELFTRIMDDTFTEQLTKIILSGITILQVNCDDGFSKFNIEIPKEAEFLEGPFTRMYRTATHWYVYNDATYGTQEEIEGTAWMQQHVATLLDIPVDNELLQDTWSTSVDAKKKLHDID